MLNLNYLDKNKFLVRSVQHTKMAIIINDVTNLSDFLIIRVKLIINLSKFTVAKKKRKIVDSRRVTPRKNNGAPKLITIEVISKILFFASFLLFFCFFVLPSKLASLHE